MPTQTPASRRFVLPSSTAPSQSQRQHGLASQFARPSQSSSSPYTRTPFSSTARKQRKDDIVADDPEDVDDNDGGDDHDPSHISSHVTPATEPLSEVGELTDDDYQSESLEDPVPTAMTQTSQRPRSSLRVQSSKRRKIAHPSSENIDNGFKSPSPPSSPTRGHDDNRSREVQLHVSRSSPPHSNQDDPSKEPPNNHSSSPTSFSPTSPAHEFQTPKHHKSRFRDPLPGLASSTPAYNATPQPVVYPSFQSRLLASASVSVPTSTSINVNPITTSPGPHIRGPRPALDLTLPDAFSPSRKRGAREYIYGGIAETVRGWVVDMATMVAGHTHTPVKPTQRQTSVMPSIEGRDETHTDADDATIEVSSFARRHKVIVEDVLLVDGNGRFVLIQSRSESMLDDDDKMGQNIETWMLINTDPQSRMASRSSSSSRNEAHSRLSGVKPGKIIKIKGGDNMTWDLNIMAVDSNMEAVKTCKVAVLWDVV